MNWRLTLVVLSVWAICQGFATAQNQNRNELEPFPVQQERTWHTSKGPFVGKLIHTRHERSEPSRRYVFETAQGKSIELTARDLAESDRDWVAQVLEWAEDQKSPPPKPDPDKFELPGLANRTSLPVIDQSDYGKSNSCVPSSFANFLLWWDQEGFLPIDKRGDFDDKADWIHDRLHRFFGTRATSGTNYDDAMDGVQRYFKDEKEGVALYTSRRTADMSPETLAFFTQGYRATLLEVSVYKDDEYDGSHLVALAEADDNGIVQLITWGNKIEGRVRPVDPDERFRDEPSPASVEIEFLNRETLSSWIRTEKIRFIVDPERFDSLWMIEPYKLKAPQFANAPVPKIPPPNQNPTIPLSKPAPEPGVTPAAAGTPNLLTVTKPVMIQKATIPTPDPRIWTREDGKQLRAVLTDVNIVKKTVQLNADGKLYPIPLDTLSPKDRAYALLWADDTNPGPQSGLSGRLVYQMRDHQKTIVTYELVYADDRLIGKVSRTSADPVLKDSSGYSGKPDIYHLDFSNGTYQITYNQGGRRVAGRFADGFYRPRAELTEFIELNERANPVVSPGGWPARELEHLQPFAHSARDYSAIQVARLRAPAVAAFWRFYRYGEHPPRSVAYQFPMSEPFLSAAYVMNVIPIEIQARMKAKPEHFAALRLMEADIGDPGSISLQIDPAAAECAPGEFKELSNGS